MTDAERIAELEKMVAALEHLIVQLLEMDRDKVVERIVANIPTPATLADIPAVDRSARVLADGSPVTEDHCEIDPRTGQQKYYVVLSPEERAKGFVRPVRRTYEHLVCNTTTTMSQSIAETYARDPKFYSGTFCCNCRGHFPVGANGEFIWLDDGTKVGT